MNRITRILIFAAFAAVSGITVTCTPEACFEETNAYVKAFFYSNITKEITAPDSITLHGIGNSSSMIYDATPDVQPALLPLDASSGFCTFVLKINGITDTLTFRYSSYPRLISKECGYTFYHNLDTIFHTKNIIDFIYRSSSGITTKNEENIRIFF
ncbi:MAG: DUF6452 family protein [Bacteroidales bacterium]|jgi:hypothetical protein|nr:DUF6452 family protein [Bacteroidales bacterium]